MHKKIVYLILLFILIAIQNVYSNRTFSIDYKNNVFLKGGKEFRYISGEIHYFRIHSSLWNDRLMRVRSAGLNAVQVYVPWNFHENVPGLYDFESSERNLTKFLSLAQQNNLYVLLRIGPYSCAEWNNGGLPYWLMRYQNIKQRTADER